MKFFLILVSLIYLPGCASFKEQRTPHVTNLNRNANLVEISYYLPSYAHPSYGESYLDLTDDELFFAKDTALTICKRWGLNSVAGDERELLSPSECAVYIEMKDSIINKGESWGCRLVKSSVRFNCI